MEFYNLNSKKNAYQLNTFDEDQKIINDVIEEIKKQIDIKRTSIDNQTKIGKHLAKFKCFDEYKNVILFNSYDIEIKTKSFNLLVLTVNSTINRIVHRNQMNREEIAEFEFVGFVRLKKDYGHTYIRPEKISDKINELFNPIEIDFDQDKEFSKKYYVLSSDEENLRKQISTPFLSSIKKYKGLEIEIKGHFLIVRLNKRISLKTATKIINFLARINDGIN